MSVAPTLKELKAKLPAVTSEKSNVPPVIWSADTLPVKVPPTAESEPEKVPVAALNAPENVPLAPVISPLKLPVLASIVPSAFIIQPAEPEE